MGEIVVVSAIDVVNSLDNRSQQQHLKALNLIVKAVTIGMIVVISVIVVRVLYVKGLIWHSPLPFCDFIVHLSILCFLPFREIVNFRFFRVKLRSKFKAIMSAENKSYWEREKSPQERKDKLREITKQQQQ